MASISNKIPVFRKRISDFISKEDGRITKENITKAGVLAAIVSIGASMNAKPAKATISPASKCPLNPAPEMDCDNCDDTYEAFHNNQLALTKSGNTFTGTHEHCGDPSIHASHSSHSSHSSHGSHCAGGFWKL